MKRALAAIALLLCACGGEAPHPPAPGTPKKPYIIPPPNDDAERSSAVNLANGATVVSRSGEALLESSAIAAIDGDPVSFWSNPPKDFPLSLVIALAAPARIDKVGLRAPEKADYAAKELVFETSMDGRSFQPLTTVKPKSVADPQWFDVRPADAAFLRVTVPAPAAENGDVALSSILAHGRELAPPRPGTIDGCWSVNGRPASFETRGARTLGAMQYARDTLYFDGGSNGRFWRFEWIRGEQFGYAVAAVSPDGKHLNALQWHEEAVPLFFGDAWFGEREECGLQIQDDVARNFIRHTGRHSLYALRFAPDGTLETRDLKFLADLLRESPKARLVAHEFREKSPEANRARAQRALDSLAAALHNAGVEPHSVTFVAAGSDNPRQIPGSEAARELYSTVDLEVGR